MISELLVFLLPVLLLEVDGNILAPPTFRVILPKFSLTFLAWSGPVPNVARYDIKYTVDGVQLAVPRQRGNVNSYTVRNITDHIGKAHAVSIRARISRRWSPFSEPVEFVFMPIVNVSIQTINCSTVAVDYDIQPLPGKDSAVQLDRFILTYRKTLINSSKHDLSTNLSANTSDGRIYVHNLSTATFYDFNYNIDVTLAGLQVTPPEDSPGIINYHLPSDCKNAVRTPSPVPTSISSDAVPTPSPSPTSISSNAVPTPSPVPTSISSDAVPTPSPTSTSISSGVLVSFKNSEYTVSEGTSKGVVRIVLKANTTADFSYTVEIDVNDVSTTSGVDYSVPSLNVTMRAGRKTAVFSVGIRNDFLLERMESFQCSISRIYSPSQDVPIEWDTALATVNITDDDHITLSFAKHYYLVYENVSSIPVTVQASGNATFEYTVNLVVVGETPVGSNITLPSPNEVVFRPYQDSATIRLFSIGDSLSETSVERFIIVIRVPSNLEGLVSTAGSVSVEIVYDESCPEYFVFPHTNVGQLAAIPCSSIQISNEPGMYGDIVSKCEIGGVWGTVNMSRCTFRRTVPSHPVLWLVELDNMNITELRQLISLKQLQDDVSIKEFPHTSDTGRHDYSIQFSNNVTFVEVREVIGSRVLKSTIVLRGEGCNCCGSAEIDMFNSNHTFVKICEAQDYAQGACSCENKENECVDPYIREAGGRCYLDTDGDNVPDYVDKCPYEFGVDCMTSTPPPPGSKCPSEVDAPWRLHWRDTKRGSTLYTRCPGGIEVSAGLASRKCGLDGEWGEVNTTECISRAFKDIKQKRNILKEVLNRTILSQAILSDSQRAAVTGLTQEIGSILDVIKEGNRSILPRDLTTTTDFMEDLARLSESNGLFAGQNNSKLKQAAVHVISGVLDSGNEPAFRAFSMSKEMAAVSLLRSTELLTRTGFLLRDESLPPHNAPSNESQNVVEDENIVVQVNRINSSSLMSPAFQVIFPGREYNNFARTALIPRMVIPGSYIKALIAGTLKETRTPTSATTPTTLPATPTTETDVNNRTASTMSLSVVCFTLNNIQEHLPLRLATEKDGADIGSHIESGSLIVSCQVVGVENTAVDSGETVNITFTLLDNVENIAVGPGEKKVSQCASWNFTGGRGGSGGWSFSGISKVFENGSHVQCTAKYLTNFMVLVGIVPIEKPPLLPLFPWITHLGCGISLLCLLLSVVFFVSLRRELIVQKHNFIHLNLCLALACGLVVFLGGVEHAAKYDMACKMVSVFQHYFVLTAFCWTLCEAVRIYTILVGVTDVNHKKWIYIYLLLGWGFPVPVVVISAAIRHYNYVIRNTNNENFACWLPVADGLIAAFITPMLAILLVNAVLLIISMSSFANSKCGKNEAVKKEPKETVETSWRLAKASLILMPLMGFTWVIGLLAVGPGQDVLAIMFVVLNSLQGLCIFLLYVVRHEKSWSKIKAVLQTCKKNKPTQLSGTSSETRSTLTSSFRKSFSNFKSITSSGDHKTEYYITEASEVHENLASSMFEEDFQLKPRNTQQSYSDDGEVQMTTTTFGNFKPNITEEEKNISTQPKPTESKVAPDVEPSKVEEPTVTATSFGFGAINVEFGFHPPGES